MFSSMYVPFSIKSLSVMTTSPDGLTPFLFVLSYVSEFFYVPEYSTSFLMTCNDVCSRLFWDDEVASSVFYHILYDMSVC